MPELRRPNIREAWNSLKSNKIDPFLVKWGERIMRFYDRTPDSEKNIDLAKDLAAEGYRMLFVGNHQGYADGLIAGTVANEVVEDERNKLQKLDIFLAQSMMDGKQGLPAKLSYEIHKPYMNSQNTYAVGTVREKEELSKHPDTGIYTSEEVDEINAKLGRRRLLSNRNALITLPEATMEGGRKDPNNKGNIKGIQEIKELGLATLLTTYLERNIKFAVVPFYIHGSNKLANPTTKLPGLTAVIEVLKKNPKKLAEVGVGKPLRDDQLLEMIGIMADVDTLDEAIAALKEKPALFFEAVMGIIAAMIPYEDAKGKHYNDGLGNLQKP